MRKMKEMSIVEQQRKEREKIYHARPGIAAIVLLICFISSDFLCFNSFSEQLFNEDVIISILVSVIGAIGVDVSLYGAGLAVSTPVPETAEARRNRRVSVFLYFMCFLICYVGLIYLAQTAAFQAVPKTDIFTDGTLFRVLLPAATSLLSFALGWRTDCTTALIHLLEKQIDEISEEIDIRKTNCQRMRTALEKYDPDAYDEKLYLCALERLDAQMNLARIAVAEAMAVELNGDEASLNALLGRHDFYDPETTIHTLKDYEPEIAPDEIHHSGRIPEHPEETKDEVIENSLRPVVRNSSVA